MTTNGAVFFLGNKAHYQVLDIPTNAYTNTNTNGNQEMVNSNIPTVHANHTTKNLNNYGINGYIDTLTKPSTSSHTSPTLSQYNNETNSVILNHTANEAYFTNAPINNHSYSEETQYNNKTRNSKDAIINIDEEIGFLGNGVKHRSKKYGASNGSSEFILNDNDDLCNLNPSDLNSLDNDINKNKLPKRSRTFTASALLRALMARRRKRPEPLPPTPEPYVNLDYMTCSYRDSCRCLDCQSRYFECDDDDDDDDDFMANYTANEYNLSQQYNEASNNYYDDESDSHYDGSNSHYDGSNSHHDGSNSHHDGSNSYNNGSNSYNDGPNGHYDLASVSDESVSDCRDLEAGCYEEYLEDSDDDEVFLKPTPTTAASSTDPLIAPKESNPQPTSTTAGVAEEKLELELAAGAPVFFNHLLNHPFSCSIQ